MSRPRGAPRALYDGRAQESGVWLKDGPMDGWFVKSGAPALADEVWVRQNGGRYVMGDETRDGTPVAAWQPTDS